MVQIKAVILENIAVAEEIYKMILRAPEIAAEAKPGQFVQVRCENNALLRRPFSLAEIERSSGKITLLYKVVGKGTEYLSWCHPKDCLDIVGPLGNGFNLELEKQVLIVGGGIGIASLFPLVSALKHSEIAVLFGEKTVSLSQYVKQQLEQVSIQQIHFTTEDGSYGDKGTVCTVLKKVINDMEISIVYACGPRPMLKEVAKIADEAKISCQVSLESLMACGIRICLGCAVKTEDGFKRICKDGPVFDAKEVIWNET